MLTTLEACAAVVPEEATLRSAITDMNAWEQRIAAQLEVPAGHATAAPESVYTTFLSLSWYPVWYHFPLEGYVIRADTNTDTRLHALPAYSQVHVEVLQFAASEMRCGMMQAWIEVARQAAAVEIDATEVRTRILMRIAVERWSSATSQLLTRDGGAPLTDVDAALEAARSIEGAAKSAAYTRASEAVAALRDVRRRSSEVLGAIDHAHERSATQVRLLNPPGEVS